MKYFAHLFYFSLTFGIAAGQPIQPIMRNNASMTFNAQLGETVMYGGTIHSMNPVKMRDSAVWSWNGERWKILTTAPSLRGDAIFAFDAASKNLVLHGGRFSLAQNIGTNYNDTWEFDGTKWKQTLKNALPESIAHSAGVYDPGRKMVILFGGHALVRNKMINETWGYQNAVWTALDIADPPPARCLHALFYDAKRKGVVLIGGMNENGPLNDMWLLDKQGWKKLNGDVPFFSMGAYTTVSLGESGEYLAFISSHDEKKAETWIWSNEKWNKLDIVNPSPRNNTSLAFDAARNCVVLFGGDRGIESLNDTWEFSMKERSWKLRSN